MKIPNNRTMRPLVIATSLLFVVILAIHWADEMFALRDEVAAVHQLRLERQQLAERTVALQLSRDDIKAQLAELNRSAMSSAGMTPLRHELVEMVRAAKCQLRQIRVEPGSQRRWSGPDDNPQAHVVDEENSSEFVLHNGHVAIIATGPLENVRGLIRNIHARNLMKKDEHLEIRPLDQKGTSVELNIRFTVYGLTRESPSLSDDDNLT